MNIFKDELKRRDFIKRLGVGGFSMIYGCSKKTKNPITNSDFTPKSNKTKIALYKTDNRIEGIKRDILSYIVSLPAN